MKSQKLKLGLLLDSFDLPAWWFRSLERIANSDFAEFVVVLMKDSDNKDNHASGLNKLWQNRREIVYHALNKVDERIFSRTPNAFKMMNAQEMLAGIPVINVRPVSGAGFDDFQPEDVNKIKGYDLDILIKVGFQGLRGEILHAAKYGIWLYDHTDNRLKRGGPPGFWEVVESWPETGATLLIADECSQSGWAVYRSRFLTYPFSPARTRNTSFWVSSSFLPRQIELLHRLGEAKFFQETSRFNREFDFYDSQQYQVPNNLESIRFYTRLLVRNLNELVKRGLHQDAWYLMFDFPKSKSLSLADFKKILPPKDRFWADPQVIHKDDKYFIFVEEYLYRNQKGHISVIEMDAGGHCKASIPVLETDYHLSYPFVFEYEDKFYMVPESAHNRTIDLYECVEFPTRWKFKMSLMKNVIAKDTTLFFQQGKWWLFTGLVENEGANPEVELCIFCSDDLFSTEWKSHPLNPVVSDVTAARPAGKIFSLGGKIYRPSQDCSRNYGYGININEILCLNENEYLEKKVATIKPNWDKRLVAAHTYTFTDGLIVIDAYTRRRKFS